MWADPDTDAFPGDAQVRARLALHAPPLLCCGMLCYAMLCYAMVPAAFPDMRG